MGGLTAIDPTRDFPNLMQVLGCYLHQDFALDFETPDQALRAAADGQGSEQVGAAIGEIDELLASDISAREVGMVVDRLTAGYSPELDGWNTRDWLVHARAILEGGA